MLAAGLAGIEIFTGAVNGTMILRHDDFEARGIALRSRNQTTLRSRSIASLFVLHGIGFPDPDNRIVAFAALENLQSNGKRLDLVLRGEV